MLEAILNYEFLQNAFLIGIIIGFLAPLIGIFVVIRRLSFIADTLSHVSLAGISFSIFINNLFSLTLNPIYFGMVFAIAGSLVIESIRSVFRQYKEISMPIVMSLGVALSVIFISLANGMTVNFINYLFGSINTVTRSDLTLIIVMTIVVTTLIFVFRNKLIVLSFDEEYSKIAGIPVKFLQLVFIVMLAIVISISLKIVGVLLVSALMIIPVSASMKVANNLKSATILAIVFSEISILLGLTLAFYFDIPSGGTIVLMNILILFMTIISQKANFFIRNK